ncbi:MAG: hypothetical protein AB1597_08005 [Chloroflexota bacterium]
MQQAESGELDVFVSDFAWDEIYKAPDAAGKSGKERLRRVATPLQKAAHLDEWKLGVDILGHTDSSKMDKVLSRASRPDREQFLSYAAIGLDYFVTEDKHYLRKTVRNKLTKEYGLIVCSVAECVEAILNDRPTI